MGLGAMVGTGIFVSVAQATNVAGEGVLVAIIVAAMVATFNGLSSAQLAAAHPVSGGTYEYGYRWLHPSLGFTAGWMFLCAKSASAATAALGFASYAMRLFQIEADSLRIVLGLFALAVVALFVLLGVRWSSIFNACVVSVTLASLLTFVIAGIFTIWFPSSDNTGNNLTSDNIQPHAITGSHRSGLLEACALMFVAYTGYGRIATLGEEIRNPRKYIPIAIIVTLGVSMVLYLCVTWVSIQVVGTKTFGDTTDFKAAPLENVARSFHAPQVSYLIATGAITAMLGVLINLVLGLSRVVLAMGRRKDLPELFGQVDDSGRSPTSAVILVSAFIAVLILIGNVKTTWSFSAFTVLIYYAITNLAALRLTNSERRFPRIFAWLGLVSCFSLAFFVDPAIWLVGLGLIGLGLLWWRFFKGWCLS